MNKKEIEFDCFLNFCQLHLGHEIAFEQLDPPAPDIIFSLNNKKIGCELTTIFIDNEPGKRESATRKYESTQRLICNNVRKWLKENVPIKLEILLDFRSNIIHYSEIHKVSEEIIQVIVKYIPEMNLEESSHISIKDYDIIPYELGYISINSFPRLKKTYVNQAGSSFIPKLNRDKITANIIHKERLIQNYRHLTDSNWLLLIINESLFSSEFDFDEENFENIDSIFDKVFIFARRNQKILTIK